MFPPVIVSKSDPFERPKKKRKMNSQSPPQTSEIGPRELEMELASGEILFFVPDPMTNGGGLSMETAKQERKWSLMRGPFRTEGSTSVARTESDNVLVKSCISANIEFESSHVCVWDVDVSKSDLPKGLKIISKSGKGNGLSIYVRTWRWVRTTRNDI